MVAGDILKRGLQLGNVCNGVEPQEAANIGNLGSSRGKAGVRHLLDGRLDLCAVEAVGMERVPLEHVGASIEGDGR
jgi:hypothetical protein